VLEPAGRASCWQTRTKNCYSAYRHSLRGVRLWGCGATRLISNRPDSGCAGSRMASRSSSRSAATSCARSNGTSRSADRLPWLLAGLDVLPGRYGNAGRLCHRADRHSSRCSANTAATGMALWAALTVVAVVGLVGLVWVVFALVVLALVAGV
jgi:cobalamin biosynthesis Mg chelatase CobN